MDSPYKDGILHLTSYPQMVTYSYLVVFNLVKFGIISWFRVFVRVV